MTIAHSPTTWIVSNRLPWSHATDAEGRSALVRSPGGLVSALLPVHQTGSAYWVGHGGFPADLPGLGERLAEERLIDVPISSNLYDPYYNGAANGCLWPIFHYFPTRASFSKEEWNAYRIVNQLFAEVLLARVGPGDLVWVHDYQLMLLPAMLRQAMPDLRIGYFHHVPFPASEVLKLLPWREELLSGLLGADLIGFHTLEYSRHFASACGRLLDLEVRGEQIHSGDRIVRTEAFPLGIDTAAILSAFHSPDGQAASVELARSLAGKRLILGVDRLDYTKGIRERLEAFAQFLRQNPAARHDTVFLQLCVPSRVVVPTYINLRTEIEQLVSRINGEFGTVGNQPVHYLFQSRGLAALTALYRRADICLVTPLRDGLNLVCKECCAAREDLGGMLIISEFAGASEELGEALVVNPFDTEAVVAAISQALEMTDAERKRRMHALRGRVMEADNKAWATAFLAELNTVAEDNALQASRRIDEPGEAARFRGALEAEKRWLVTIDSDAFASRYASRTDLADILQALTGERIRATILLTSAKPELAPIPGIRAWLGPENGAVLVDPEGNHHQIGHPLTDLGPQQSQLERILTELARKVPRSRLTKGSSTITWTMGGTRSDMAKVLLKETRSAISSQVERLSWHCARIHGGLSVRSSTDTLPKAMGQVLAAMPGTGPIKLLTIGDRYSEELLFTYRRPDNISIAIGTPTASSSYLVADGSSLIGSLIGEPS